MSETLSRLSSKVGVRCTILISATTGSILQSKGTLPAFANATTTTLSSNPAASADGTSATKSPTEEPLDGMEEMARVAYHFVKSVGSLVQSLDPQVWETPLCTISWGSILIRFTGRGQIAATSNQEIWTRYSPRSEVYLRSCSRNTFSLREVVYDVMAYTLWICGERPNCGIRFHYVLRFCYYFIA